jgi:hypothetical protein
MRARAARRKAHRAVQAVQVPREWQSSGDRATGHQAALVGVLSGWGRSIPSGQGTCEGQRADSFFIVLSARAVVIRPLLRSRATVSPLPVVRRETVLTARLVFVANTSQSVQIFSDVLSMAQHVS